MRTLGITWWTPTGIRRPNSRSRPRIVLMRAVRVASQVDRRRCRAARACWVSDFTGCAGQKPQQRDPAEGRGGRSSSDGRGARPSRAGDRISRIPGTPMSTGNGTEPGRRGFGSLVRRRAGSYSGSGVGAGVVWRGTATRAVERGACQRREMKIGGKLSSLVPRGPDIATIPSMCTRPSLLSRSV